MNETLSTDLHRSIYGTPYQYKHANTLIDKSTGPSEVTTRSCSANLACLLDTLCTVLTCKTHAHMSLQRGKVRLPAYNPKPSFFLLSGEHQVTVPAMVTQASSDVRGQFGKKREKSPKKRAFPYIVSLQIRIFCDSPPKRLEESKRFRAKPEVCNKSQAVS